MRVLLAILLLGSWMSAAWAQDEPAPAPERHPLLDSRMLLTAGAFWPDEDLKLRANGSLPGEEIDFDGVFRFSESDATPFASFHWRYGKKWSLGADFWQLDTVGGAILDEDYVWDDLIFREGTFARAGFDLSVARIFTGRTLWTGDNYETGVGFGVHWLDITAFIEGEVIVNEQTTEFQRGDTSAEFPLPNLGLWYLHSLSARWAFSARVDWLSASLDKYSGELWNAQVGIHYQPWRRVGFSLHAAYFELDGRIKEDDWRGQVEIQQYGPRASVYVTF
jgi:hypothetical protein